jgi:hypothetical protein
LTVDGHVERVPLGAIATKRPAQVELPEDTDAAIVQRLGAITVATAEPLPPPVDDSVVETVPRTPDWAARAPAPAVVVHDGIDDANADRLPTGRLALEVGVTFPPGSTTRNTPRDTSNQSLGLDATVAYDVGGHVQVGGVLSLVQWRNYQTAFLDQESHLYLVDAFARYVLVRGRFRPYAMIDVGAGLSSLAPGFTIYDLGQPGTTMIADPTGFAYTYAAGVGFARTLVGPWSIVGQLAARRTTLDHSLSFTPMNGTTSAIDHLTLDEIDARFAVAYWF